MKVLGVDAQLVKWGGIGLCTLAFLVIAYLVVGDATGAPRRAWTRYLAFLGLKLRRLFIFMPPSAIAIGQVLGLASVLMAEVMIGIPAFYLLLILIAVGPAYQIEKMRQKRVEQIEEQIDGFMLALANALKATPSLGDAFRTIGPIIGEPLRQEVELAVKEMRVGSSLDQALLMMAGRVGSRQFDSALSAVLIGRQVGGNLPRILDSTAASLREMRRLDGVVRTKTAEGKMQLWVLAVFPFALAGMLHAVSPGYFDPLTGSVVGYMCVILASLFWIASLVVARKILSVDL